MGQVIVGVLALLVAGLALAADSSGRTPRPAVEPAKAGTQCVEAPETMRRSHMDLLRHQRDNTVRGGIRGAKHSLKACVDCHASRATASVSQASGDFCVSCHSYAAVKIDCFECHTGKARAVAQESAK